MRPSDMAATAITTIFGLITGLMVAGPVLGVVGAVVGAVFGVVAGRANVRPAITMAVFVGAMAGVLVGSSIVETICLPGSCAALEATAGVVVGLASLFGVGLVAALVTRSFDEYKEYVVAGEPPPTAGCETEQDSSEPGV